VEVLFATEAVAVRFFRDAPWHVVGLRTKAPLAVMEEALKGGNKRRIV
jgi:hypothetical protein